MEAVENNAGRKAMVGWVKDGIAEPCPDSVGGGLKWAPDQ